MGVIGNEIIFMHTTGRGGNPNNPGVTVTAMLLGNLDPPIEVEGVRIVPFPVSSFPPSVQALIPDEWIGPLNSGTAFADLNNGAVASHANNPDQMVNAKMRERYDQCMPDSEATLRYSYRHVGRVISCVPGGGKP